MEFLVAGASAVQIGTANFYDPTASIRIVDSVAGALAALGAGGVKGIVGTFGTSWHKTQLRGLHSTLPRAVIVME